jgi:hypothetical protein
VGNILSSVLGTNSQYQATPAQAGNPYAQGTLQQEANNQAQIYAQQQQLAQQMQATAAGQGPNPAQQQYMQNMQNNVAGAQGLIASQRGLNPALAARMGANAATSSNNQAAAQSGIMQAQQQLAAQQNLGSLYGNMQQGNIGQQQLYTGANQGAMQTNAAVANANQQASQGLLGGIGGSIGSILGLSHADGGMIDKYADGGTVASSYLNQGFGPLGAMGANPAMQKGLGSLLSGGISKLQSLGGSGATQMAGGPGDAGGLDMSAAALAAHGGRIHNFKPGGKVPGKASVPGDSLKNDTVPAIVSPGEIVIPRSVAQSKDAPQQAAKFVGAVLARHGLGKKK